MEVGDAGFHYEPLSETKVVGRHNMHVEVCQWSVEDTMCASGHFELVLMEGIHQNEHDPHVFFAMDVGGSSIGELALLVDSF